jgi:MoxR-like ATPase
MSIPSPYAPAEIPRAEFLDRVVEEVHRRVVGQQYMIERLLIGLLTGGHVLFEGLPGLAKTLAVRTLAETIHASFQRIQFTPDLLPPTWWGRRSTTTARASSCRTAGRSSPTSCWPTR